MSESEQIAGLIAEIDFDAVILNICTVKGDSSALKAVRNAKKDYPEFPMLVTGCVTKELIAALQKIDPKISVASTHAVERIPSILKKMMAGETIIDLQKEHSPKLGLPKIRKNPIVGIVSIAEGYIKALTYHLRLYKKRFWSGILI